jgi:hypothetical protein
MNYSIKATLLSALIFPGLGQLLLKYYKTGISLAILAFVCIVTVVSQAMSKALSIVEQIEQQGGSPDPVQIAAQIEQLSQQYDTHMINLAMSGLILCWFVSVVHAYFAGRARDAEKRDSTKQTTPD